MREKSVTTADVSPRIGTCPDCGADVPIYPHYSPWCEQCNWNLQPMKEPRPTTSWREFQVRLGERSDENLFQAVNQNHVVSPRFTWTRAFSLLLATIIHAVTIVGVIYSARLIAVEGLSPQANIALIVFCILLLWAGFPRFDSVPPNMVLTESADFPAINELVERVANALQVDKPLILMTEQFTATFGRVGHRRQPVLCLGHPFLSILNEQELVSLVAHELSHSHDGAITRSAYVRIALTTLDRWNMLLRPERLLQFKQTWLIWLLSPVTITLLLAVLPIRSLIFVLEVCCFRDSQLAEYVADANSLPVAGTQQAVSLLKKSYYRHLEALRIAYDTAPALRKYASLKGQLNRIPSRELERVWRIAQRQQMTLRSTHPSLRHRVAFLENSESRAPSVTVDPFLFTELHRELEAWPQVIKDREEALKMSLAESNIETAQDALFVPAD